jgi:hypothetical protein
MEFSFFTYHDRNYASLSIISTDSFIYLLGIVEINLNFFELMTPECFSLPQIEESKKLRLY